MGSFDIPEKAFANQNFHCGFYADGDELEKILHFRRDTLEDLLEQISNNISGIQRQLTRIFRNIIKKDLLKKSDPLNALKKKNVQLIKRFYAEDSVIKQ